MSLYFLLFFSDCGPQEEDELYENHIVETNMIYKLEKNKLVPVEEYWGNQPKVEMLKPDQVGTSVFRVIEFLKEHGTNVGAKLDKFV